MANIRSFPNNQDEYIGAEHVMRWHHGRSSGVFGADGNAAVTAVLDTMAVAVSDGTGWIANENADGIVWWVDNEKETGSKLQLPVDMADAALPRIDRVIVSWQTTNYVALPEVKILKGVPASIPVAPELTNDGLERQISLAAITIPAGTTAITGSMISDERLDDSVCGLVTEKVGIDTSVMSAQFAAFMEESIERQKAYIEEQQGSWDAFFENVANDTLVPVPASDDTGKVVIVNATGDGYTLGEAQTEIPITADPPADSDIWIDPTEYTPEAGHVLDKNNPHNVTIEQIGAAADDHKHSASDVTSGTLPVSHGGTGATNTADALANLMATNGTAIKADDDLNNYTTAGIYYATVSVAGTLSNTPTSAGFKLVVERGYSGTDRAIQTLYTGVLAQPTYTRKLVGGTWSDWAAILTNAGGTLTTNAAFMGATSASQVAVMAAPNAQSGSGLWVYGNDHTQAGQCTLQVYNQDTKTYYVLRARPDGSIYWGGYVLLKSQQYGDTLPAAGNAGRIFFKKV